MAATRTAERIALTEDLDTFLTRAGRIRDKERFQRSALRYIQGGSAGFIAYLDRQDDAVAAQMSRLRRLIAGGGHYQPQLQELQAERDAIAVLRKEADDIRRAATGPDSHLLDEAYARQTIRTRIEPLKRNEALLRAQRARVQGPMVQSRTITGTDCQGRVEEAIVMCVQYLNAVAADPHAWLSRFWRVLTREGTHLSIWLYSHEPEKKWKSQFFRIEITRSLTALDFTLESYVPFGFPGDQAQYRMEASNVFRRVGWQQVDVTSTSWNRANTYSLNASTTDTIGVSFGTNSSVSSGVQDSVSYTSSESISLANSFGTSETMSWFENHGDSNSGSMHGSSHSSSHGSGMGGAFAYNAGSATTAGHSTGSTVTHGTQSNTSEGSSETRSDSRAETIGYGFQLTNGTTLQMQTFAYGIDFGADAETHLKQWRHGNSDAARSFDAVQKTFDHMCEFVIGQLRGMGTGSVPFDPGAFETRLLQLQEIILFEDEPSPPGATTSARLPPPRE